MSTVKPNLGSNNPVNNINGINNNFQQNLYHNFASDPHCDFILKKNK